jgi:hypothetical protein
LAPAKKVGWATTHVEKQVRPILNRCHHCHFEAGKAYAKHPFDRPGNAHLLRERCFTCVEDEPERAAIRAFPAQGP